MRTAGSSGVLHAVDHPVEIVANQQRSILRDGDTEWPSAHRRLLPTGQEPGHERLERRRHAIPEPYANDFIAARWLAVPRAVHRDERIPAVFSGELGTGIELHL